MVRKENIKIMITLRDFLISVGLRSPAKYYYYDYEKKQRIELTEEEAKKYDIMYIYVEDGVICFEVDKVWTGCIYKAISNK